MASQPLPARSSRSTTTSGRCRTGSVADCESMTCRTISRKRATSWKRTLSSPTRLVSTSPITFSRRRDRNGRSTSRKSPRGSWITISPSTESTQSGKLTRAIPMGLTVLRLLLAPVLVWLVYADASGFAFAGVIFLAFVSDYFDGVIARRVGVSSAELRHFDSRADLVFYATAAWAVWRIHPDVARRVAIPGLVVIGLDVARHVFDFAKFGKDVAYHASDSAIALPCFRLLTILPLLPNLSVPFWRRRIALSTPFDAAFPYLLQPEPFRAAIASLL